jgi:hypothetical protein
MFVDVSDLVPTWSSGRKIPDRMFAVGVGVGSGGSQGLVPVPERGPREPHGSAG